MKRASYWLSIFLSYMEEKIVNIVLFAIIIALSIVLTPLVLFLVILFGSFILTYFITSHFYERFFRKKKNQELELEEDNNDI